MVLSTLINHPERLNRDTLYELRNIVARYPYFQIARLLMLNNMYLMHEPDFGTELRRSVLYIADRRALCRLIEGHRDRVVPEETDVVEQPGIDRTMSLIDAFLSTLPDEHSAASQLQVAGADDYVSRYLTDRQDEQPATDMQLTGQPLIDGFINSYSSETVADTREATPQNAPAVTVATVKEGIPEGLTTTDLPDGELLDESYFTETLAKIYIKQRKYSRALEIIRSLYLKYPEKNIYFADQIRFLEKLIINNNSK